MKVEEFLSHLSSVKELANGSFVGCCPAHHDRHPSLVVTEVHGRFLIYCRAGCQTEDITTALGLSLRDLFYDGNQTKRTRRAAQQRRPPPMPTYYWNWRSQCADLQSFIDGKFEKAETMSTSMTGLNLQTLNDQQLDEVMTIAEKAHRSIEQCERLYDTLFNIQQAFRANEAVQEESYS